MTKKMRATLGLVVMSVLLMEVLARADDWPQWRGPNRDGHSKETGLLKEWPKDGPRLIWQVKDLGGGYSTPSVAGGRIYVMTNKGLEDEFVTARDTKDGSLLWSTRIGKVGNPDQQPNYPAARSTPTVDGAVLYALGSDGDLVCLETATGKVRWQKSLRADFGGQPGTWAYCGVAAGGWRRGRLHARRRAGDLRGAEQEHRRGGVEVPRSPAAPGPGTPRSSSAEAGGVRQYVAYTGDGLFGVEAKTGKFLWRYDKTTGPVGMSILTPVVGEGLVYSGNDRLGGAAVRILIDGGVGQGR